MDMKDLSRVASANRTRPAKPPRTSRVVRVGRWTDSRLGLAKGSRPFIRKVFPEHWSFMLGEIALWSFVVLLLSGVFLTLWFDPSMAEVTYQGSYEQLRGVSMSRAYASTLDISFDVRGGLLLRQMHHWAAMVFIGAMFIHMMRVFVTGAFRKPREVTWMIGCLMLVLGILEGFAGYSLPDDLLSGTGLVIANGIIKSTPVVGSYASFFLFGGEFPGTDVISRFYVVHVLLIPGLLLALIALHLTLIVYHKHTQWSGPGRTQSNVVGFPFFPVYVAKATGFFFIVAGVIATMAALLSINPVWKYGPYNPAQVSAGSQPDWYLGFTEGALRIMPGWESNLFGHSISWNVLIPAQVMPVTLMVVFFGWPFLEARIRGPQAEHHLLQRPRDAPNRTASLAACVAFYGVLWAAGGNDILATRLHLSLNQITYAARIGVIVLPAIAFLVTRAWCRGLQHADDAVLAHGRETGIIVRTPSGGYVERHEPLGAARTHALATAERESRAARAGSAVEPKSHGPDDR